MFDVNFVAAGIMVRPEDFPYSQHDDKNEKPKAAIAPYMSMLKRDATLTRQVVKRRPLGLSRLSSKSEIGERMYRRLAGSGNLVKDGPAVNALRAVKSSIHPAPSH